MPKGIKKEKKVKEPKQESRSVDDKLDLLIGAVGKLVELQTRPLVSASVQGGTGGSANTNTDGRTGSANSTFTPKLDDETYPQSYVPPKYRKIVDDLLSPDFGIRVNDFDDRTDFQIDIIVPVKYSSLTADDKKSGIEDIRTRIVPRAMGENGVREWCTLIRKNLSRFYNKEGLQSPFKVAEIE